MRPAEPDDIEERFRALVAQFGDDEIRRLTDEADLGERAVRRRDRRPVRAVLLTLFAVVVIAGLVIGARPDVLGRLSSLAGGSGGEQTPEPHFGAAVARPGPTLNPVPGEPDGDTDPETGPDPDAGTGPGATGAAADPFAGSPAAGFAVGGKGIVTPHPKGLGGLSRGQVGEALRRVRRILTAAHLDPATIRGGRPAALIALLHPRQRDYFREHLDKNGPDNTRRWVFSLKPGSAEQATDVVKVDGETTMAKRHSRDGRGGVTITADYLFVYAVNRPGDPAATTRLVTHRTAEFSAYERDGKLTVWLERTARSDAGAGCGFADGFVHPDFGDAPDGVSAVEPSGSPIDPYDRKRNMARAGCFPSAPV
ncbi:hypothetical protein JOL79_01710 [Microbispora sp. RL4-1S]|uniref:Uncharacterized protein n=1 Tax=Microbispora oryzae TaxID=2806554 RepID=A0A940WBP4_9ACTN|nr:hypothetical protein [Microbispora oryzae]MBP2702515.1 hypothetical protein [Microbispora oryzae]